MNELMTIDARLPTLDEITAAPTAQLPALRSSIETALAARPTAAICGQFYWELVGRVPKCSTELSDKRIQAVQNRLLIERAAIMPPAVLREVLDRAEDEWQWRPTAREVLDFARKIEAKHRQLLKAVDEETSRRAAHAKRKEEREAALKEVTEQARTHFGMDEAAMLDAWAAAEKHLDEYQRDYLRAAIGRGAEWACEMTAILVDVNKLWPLRATEIEEQRARRVLCFDVDFVRGALDYRVRKAFCHLRPEVVKTKHGKTKHSDASRPIEELYNLLDGIDPITKRMIPPGG